MSCEMPIQKTSILRKKKKDLSFFLKKMDYSSIILTIGIPAAGKSTWVREYCKKHPNGTFVISTDQIRKELTGTEQCIDPSQNEMIHDEAKKRARDIIERRKEISKKLGVWPTIIIDSTNVDLDEWVAYKQLGACTMSAKVFDVEPDEAIERMKNRERKVPEDIIRWKWETLQKNRKYLPKIFNFIYN